MVRIIHGVVKSRQDIFPAMMWKQCEGGSGSKGIIVLAYSHNLVFRRSQRKHLELKLVLLVRDSFIVGGIDRSRDS